jgi:hypothetical protein
MKKTVMLFMCKRFDGRQSSCVGAVFFWSRPDTADSPFFQRRFTMINAYQGAPKQQMEDSEEIPYDLSYDDMDSFVRSCGVILPESGARDIESGLRAAPFI